MTAILLVPLTPDSPLLAPGKAGAMPPRFYSGWICGHASHVAWSESPREDCYMCRGAIMEALVLAIDGLPVPEGIDRAARCLNAMVPPDDAVNHYRHGYGWTDFGIRDFAKECAARLACRVVVLDADGGARG